MNNQKSSAYNIIRVLSCILVVFTHTVQNDMALLPQKYQSCAFALWVPAMVCNNLFIMLSGALLCGWRSERTSVFYKKRAVSVLIPMAAYYIVIAGARAIFLRPDEPVTLVSIILNLLTAHTPEAPQYWLIYQILGLYLFVPLLRKLLRGCSAGRLCAAIWTGFILCRVLNLFVQPGILSRSGTAAFLPEPLPRAAVAILSFAAWLCVFVMGYWISLEECQTIRRIFRALTLPALAAIILISAISKDYVLISLCAVNTSVLMTVFGLGLFSTVLLWCEKKETITRNPVLISLFNLLRTHSFGIILVHWAVIQVPAGKILHLSAAPAAIGGPAAITAAYVLISAVCLLLSLLCAFLFDRLIIFRLQKVLRQPT